MESALIKSTIANLLIFRCLEIEGTIVHYFRETMQESQRLSESPLGQF